MVHNERVSPPLDLIMRWGEEQARLPPVRQANGVTTTGRETQSPTTGRVHVSLDIEGSWDEAGIVQLIGRDPSLGPCQEQAHKRQVKGEGEC